MAYSRRRQSQRVRRSGMAPHRRDGVARRSAASFDCTAKPCSREHPFITSRRTCLRAASSASSPAPRTTSAFVFQIRTHAAGSPPVERIVTARTRPVPETRRGRRCLSCLSTRLFRPEAGTELQQSDGRVQHRREWRRLRQLVPAARETRRHHSGSRRNLP